VGRLAGFCANGSRQHRCNFQAVFNRKQTACTGALYVHHPPHPQTSDSAPTWFPTASCSTTPAASKARASTTCDRVTHRSVWAARQTFCTLVCTCRMHWPRIQLHSPLHTGCDHPSLLPCYICAHAAALLIRPYGLSLSHLGLLKPS
jgi:hypothetical protein